MVVIADKVEKTMDDYPVQFIAEFSPVERSVFTDGIDAYEKVPAENVSLAIIESNYIGIIIVLEIFEIDIKDIIVRTENYGYIPEAADFAFRNDFEPTGSQPFFLEIEFDVLIEIRYHSDGFNMQNYKIITRQYEIISLILYPMSEQKTEKAVFVGVVLEKGGERKTMEYLDELEFLAETAGAVGDKKFIQRLDSTFKATYIGTGKLEEIKTYCEENDIQYVIFDDELTGTQQRNIEKIIGCAHIIDRTSLILEIFAQRAKTSYAKMQVELARHQYMLPRLAGMWTHLERQRGGVGTRGGMGETQIEVDRRIVKERITRLNEELRKVDRQMSTQRGNRGSMVRLSLVGYTNVGKSTLMNLLAKSDVFAENKLFATLDTTVRKVVLENVPFLLSDTVGFIRKLPTQLIEAFKSTLDEVREADILVHVVDISHPDFEEQMEVVEQTLKDIGAANKPVYVVFNKIDAYKSETYDEFSLEPKGKEHLTLEELKNSWIAEEKTPCIFISATKKIGIEKLRNDLYKMVAEIHAGRYPFNNFLY